MINNVDILKYARKLAEQKPASVRAFTPLGQVYISPTKCIDESLRQLGLPAWPALGLFYLLDNAVPIKTKTAEEYFVNRANAQIMMVFDDAIAHQARLDQEFGELQLAA
jgi:hypothetical protein